ncbi:nuclear transport factor 2 family protein [Hyphococcus sp.]|uniref:nuclear transport factor 2 family protein n=1 Tax=Hyphococcus sp. TaxID=2038636 RepID=UPI003CCC11B2
MTFIRNSIALAIVFAISGLVSSGAVPQAVAQTVASSENAEYSRLEQDNKETIEALFAAFNAHDIDALAALYSEKAKLISPDFAAPRTGPDGVRKTYGDLFSMFPNIRDDVQTIIVDGDRAAAEFVSYLGVNGPDGAEISVPIATFFVIEDGKIVRDTTYYDVQ